MPNTGTQQRRKAQKEATRKWLVVACACAVWTSGCFIKRRAPARPVVNFVAVVHPMIPPDNVDPSLDPPPDISFDVPQTPAELATSRSAPVRPRVAPLPAPEPAAAENLPQPSIAPEVTTEEQTAARTETQHNLDQVEKNLASVSGRTLDATQQDLVSKVRGFAENAREAMRGGDWVRAKTLSKKAAVLSDQLAENL
ncbi:MAG: hypothetical protein WBL63_10030 [Candidatus Acidiferrum sp.]